MKCPGGYVELNDVDGNTVKLGRPRPNIFCGTTSELGVESCDRTMSLNTSGHGEVGCKYPTKLRLSNENVKSLFDAAYNEKFLFCGMFKEITNICCIDKY